jgi:hypothetical protein
VSLSLTNILNGLWDRSKFCGHYLLLARVCNLQHIFWWATCRVTSFVFCSLFNLVSVSCFVIITYSWCFEFTNHFFPISFCWKLHLYSILFYFYFCKKKTSFCVTVPMSFYYWCMLDIFNILEEHRERFMRIPWEATDFCSPCEEHQATSNWALNVITRKIGSHCTPKKMLFFFNLFSHKIR